MGEGGLLCGLLLLIRLTLQVYCIEEEDAEVLLDWIRKASAISDELHGVV